MVGNFNKSNYKVIYFLSDKKKTNKQTNKKRKDCTKTNGKNFRGV